MKAVGMSQTRARRGRPKGSGIDDRQRLDAVARLIASNPALKPTTAIRSLGVSDPSVIRRLRDKFNVVRGELMEELGSSTAGAIRRAAGAERQTRPDVPPPSVRSIDGEPSRQQRARSIAAAGRELAGSFDRGGDGVRVDLASGHDEVGAEGGADALILWRV